MLLTIGAFLLVLGVLIFVHELGHFLVARWYGVRVLTFSLGFGPKILKFTRGGTEYCISAVPLGGYVKMAGENVTDERAGAPDEFLSKSKWIRFQVYLAGPLMNIVLALIVSTIVLAGGADVPIYHTQPAIVGAVDPDSAAARAGIEPGDRIVSVNGHNTPTWDDLDMAVMPKGGREISMTIDRAGSLRTIDIVPAAEGRYEIGNLGVRPVLRPQITGVRPNMPGERAGLRRGDVLVSVGGKSPVTREEAVAIIQKNGPTPIVLGIERDGQLMDITVTPEGAAPRSLIGFDFYGYEYQRIDPSFGQAIALSFRHNVDNAKVIGRTLKDLVTRETPVNQLLGPLAIADLSGSAARIGLRELLDLMAMISLNLALLNLMPIPVMDGGQITILALEGIARRDFSVRLKERITMVGAVLILALMTVVIYNDIARILR
ncbi:MAG TPA: RIP metalloprotease RseP [Vicinamibacterales bacterium]|nr:RIP metalloprotease RseP [Vicinamibacterales bacterium]